MARICSSFSQAASPTLAIGDRSSKNRIYKPVFVLARQQNNAGSNRRKALIMSARWLVLVIDFAILLEEMSFECDVAQKAEVFD